MYGLVGSIMTLPENRETLIEALVAGAVSLPGCVSYVVGEDCDDESLVWVAEVWESADAHQASLALPHVQAAIAVAKPLIVGFGKRVELQVKGGLGLP